jgi:glycine/D-amino acid oxidase-like deaminating enzyme
MYRHIALVPACPVGHIDPAQFVVGLAEKAQGLGVQVWTKTEAMRFESAQGKITKVHTTRGALSPKQIILAAGSWSPEVARLIMLKSRITTERSKHDE